MQFAKRRDCRREQSHQRRGEHIPDADRARLAEAGLPADVLGNFSLANCRTGFVEKPQPRIGEGDGFFRFPFKEFDPQRAFERADLVGKCRGGNIQTNGSAAKMKFVSNSNEIAKVPQLHKAHY